MLIARGTADDKGPTVVCLYALRALADAGLNKKFRFIFGTDEENLWRCISRYAKLEHHPARGITPDGSFPVIHAEKGLLQFRLIYEGSDFPIHGGNAYNAVPAAVTCRSYPTLLSALDTHNYKYTENNGDVTVIGVSAHAQSCEKGTNPIPRLLECLKETGMHTPIIDFVTERIKDNPYGEYLLGDIQDEQTGRLKTNLAKIEIDRELSALYFDFRIPVSYPIDDIVSKIKIAASEYGLLYEEHDRQDSLYIPKDDPFVKSLCDIYYEETSLDPTPLTTGGATYSRALQNFVTFGMAFPHRESTAHQKNEHIYKKDIETAFTIYYRAFTMLNNS